MLTRPRSLALLAIIASAAPGAISRDKILALLWPELDEERGRNVLNQTLFGIRRDLGQLDVVLGRAELRLNTSVVACDLVQFEAAIAERALQRVAELYAGPFLDGFFLSEAPEFERWAGDLRTSVSRRAAAAMDTLATQLEHTDIHAAAELRWRIAAADPLDSRAALALVRSLAAAGDMGRAIQFARRHEAILREEVGSGVDPEMARVVEQLLEEGRTLPRSETPPASAGSASSAPLSTPRRSGRRIATAAAGLAAVAIVVAATAKRGAHNGNADATDPVVAVLPFTVRGTPGTDYLRLALPELLSRGIGGAGGLRAADARVVLSLAARDTLASIDLARAAGLAGQLKADQFVLGNVVATELALQISASIYSRRDNAPVATATVEGQPAQLLALVDRLSAQLLASQPSTGRPGRFDVGELSTHSLPALKAYLRGETDRRAGRYAQAVESFQTAVREDSTFALAWYGLSNAADWADRGELVVPAAQRAQDFSARIGDHDRMLVRAHLAWRENRSEDAEGLYRRLLRTYPDDAESWYQLGELLFHNNSRRGRTFAEAREPFRRALALVPGDLEPLMHLARIAARSGDRPEIDSVIALAMRAGTHTDQLELRTLRAFALHDTAEQRAVIQELSAGDGRYLATLAWRVGLFTTDLDGAARILRLGLGTNRPISLQLGARSTLLLILAGRGEIRAARREAEVLERSGQAGARDALMFRAFVELVPHFPSTDATRSVLRSALDSAIAADLRGGGAIDSVVAHNLECFSGMLAADGNHAAAALRQADALSRISAEPQVEDRARNCADAIRARVHWRAGRATAALDILLSQRRQSVPSMSSEPLDRYLISELLTQLHRPREASAWLESISEYGLDDLSFLAPAEYQLGLLAERDNQPEKARAHFQRVVRLWKNADPELRGMVEDAAKRLGGRK